VEQPPYALMPRRPCELPPVGAVAPLPGGPRKLEGRVGWGPDPRRAPARILAKPWTASRVAATRSTQLRPGASLEADPAQAPVPRPSAHDGHPAAQGGRPARDGAEDPAPLGPDHHGPRSTATSTSTTCARALTGSRSSRRGRCSSWRRSCRRTAPDGGFWVRLLLRCCQSARGRKTKPPEAPLSRVHPGLRLSGRQDLNLRSLAPQRLSLA
jgi:hypothetical protein